MDSFNDERPGTARDLEKLVLLKREEMPYSMWWSHGYFVSTFYHLPNKTSWNCFICITTLLAVVLVAMNEMERGTMEVFFNGIYVVHVASIMCQVVRQLQYSSIDFWTAGSFVIDLWSFSHYMVEVSDHELWELLCFYVRLHRPLRYLWSLNNENMKGSVLGTTLKYCYIFVVLRVTWALIWQRMGIFAKFLAEEQALSRKRPEAWGTSRHLKPGEPRASDPTQFIIIFYILNKLFIPIGPTVMPSNDVERIACLLVMLTGSLVMTGIAVASLSLVISLYIAPEETFRSRYKLIMEEMKGSHVPPSLRDKVETFYKMYWHKQKAVSAAQLLPCFPPTLCATVYTDIYFRATQKSRILRDLSYEFLSELAKKMQTIHYIPGDAIIKRNTTRSSIIYVTYGDVEMLTAEDDSTAILRMTRGTILSPFAGCADARTRAHVEIRAATFCTAHVLNAPDLWFTVLKYGQKDVILGAFYDHLERVRRHYCWKYPEIAPFKSSILHFKRKLMKLKEAKNGEVPKLAKTDVMMEIAGSYVMRNRADASLTEESDAICLRMTFPCILQPSSSLQVAWHALVTCIILVVSITHPYYLVYKKEVPIQFRFYDYFVTIIFLIDIVVHLSTAENVEDGVPITLAQTASQQARSKWFFLDVIATVPIFEITKNGHFAGINKLLRLHKVFRILKRVEDECVYHSNALRFLSYSLLLLIACYLLAALQQGFMCYGFDYCLVTNITHSPYWSPQPLDDTVESRLTFTLYWSISMITFTSHKQDFGAADALSVVYIMLVLELCIVLHIFMEAVYSATIMVTTAMRENYDACIESVTSFLIKNNVEPILTERFKSYLELCWYTDKAYSMTNKRKSIFHDLPPHVHQDIVTRQRSKYMLCIPFMKFLHKEELKTIASNARLFCTCPNEILLNTGDMSNEMYVIKQGICEVLCPITKDVVGELTTRNHFGVIACMLRLPTFYTIRAVTHVQVFSISRKFLMNATEIPQIKDAINFAREQPEYEFLQTPYPRFVTYTPSPPTPNVERFPLPRKHEKDFAFLHPFNRLGFLSILRYIFPRFTIRPDGPYLARYEWFRAACALFSAMVFPTWTYFILQWPFIYYVKNILDFAAYLDILQRVLIGYYNEKGLLVYHPASTAAHYLKGTFMVDLLACLPLENLEISVKVAYEGRYHVRPTIQYLSLNRLIQLYRTPGAFISLKGYVRRDIIIVLKAIPPFIALLNILTCFIIFNSVKLITIDGNEYELKPFDDEGGSWIYLYRNIFRFNITESAWNLHLATYFWVVYETTNTGYNTFNPSNFKIMRILIVGMIIGAMITTYYSVRIISTRANVNKALAAFQQHMKDIERFMNREHLDPKLKKEVLDYYVFNWDKMGGMDYRKVFKLCDHITLRTDAIVFIYGSTFSECPIINQCDVALLRLIGRAVNTLLFLKNTNVICLDDVISDLYFVDQGIVELRYYNNDNIVERIKLGKGSMFGNLKCLKTLRSPVQVVSVTQVRLLYMNATMFYTIINEFPNIVELLDTSLKNDENYVLGTEEIILLDKEEANSSRILILCQKMMGLIHENSSFVQSFLIIISLGCIYMDVYNAGFQDNTTTLIVFLYLMDICFCYKFLIQYLLPHAAGQNHELMEILLKEKQTYFKKEFKMDFMSVLPIEALCLFSANGGWLLFSFLRLNRLLRITTVYKCLQQRHESISVNLIFTTTISVFIWMTMFIHISTCVWYFIGVMEEERAPHTSWFYSARGQPFCENKYICSLYFILTTFTQNGVGDILPKKQSEVIFVCILQLVSTMVYMIYVGEFSNIIQYYSFRSFGYYCKIIELKEFLKNNRVSRNLVKLVHKYALHLWAESRGVQLPHFLKNAPHCLKLRVMSAAYLHHLNAHPIFRNCEPVFLKQLVGFFELYTYRKDMYVVKENERTDCMYFVHSGRVLESSINHCITRLYFAGESFGSLQGLVHNIHFPFSYITVMNTQILSLNLNDWEHLLEHFPQSKEIIENFLRPDDDDDDPDIESERKDIDTVDEPQTPSMSKDSKFKRKSSVYPSEKETKIIEMRSSPWPMESRSSVVDENVLSYDTKFEENNSSHDLHDDDIKMEESVKSELVIKTTDEDLLLNEEEEATQALLAKIKGEEPETQAEISNHPSLEDRSKRPEESLTQVRHMKSVDDYILGRYGEDTVEQIEEETNINYDEPTSTARLKHGMHVQYEQGTKQETIESHELKPIRDTSTYERNLKSLDSDIDPQIASEDKSIISRLSEEDGSETSVTKRRRKSHNKQK